VKEFIMSRQVKLVPANATPVEVPGLAYFTEGTLAAATEKAARKPAKPTALDQMFAYYTAE
jgi:hypothetical protein